MLELVCMGQTTTLVRKLLDGRLRLETRNSNPVIYARARVQGKLMNYRTGETTSSSRLAWLRTGTWRFRSASVTASRFTDTASGTWRTSSSRMRTA